MSVCVWIKASEWEGPVFEEVEVKQLPGDPIMVIFLCRPTVHAPVLCILARNLPSALKLSRLARSVCEYLKVLPQEENEAGISPSRGASGYPGGTKSPPENTSQIHKGSFVTLSPLKKLSCKLPQQLQDFHQWQKRWTRRMNSRKTNKFLIKRSAGTNIWSFSLRRPGTKDMNHQWQLSRVDVTAHGSDMMFCSFYEFHKVCWSEKNQSNIKTKAKKIKKKKLNHLWNHLAWKCSKVNVNLKLPPTRSRSQKRRVCIWQGVNEDHRNLWHKQTMCCVTALTPLTKSEMQNTSCQRWPRQRRSAK